MAKKNPMKVFMMFGMAILVILGIVSAGLYIGTKVGSKEGTSLPGVPDDTDSGISRTDYLCAQTPTVNGKFRVSNAGASSTEWLATVTGYWIPKGNLENSATLTQTSGASTGTFSGTAVSLNCGEEYELQVVDDANNYTYTSKAGIKVGVSPVDVTLNSHNASALQARIKDNVADAYWKENGGTSTFSNLADTWNQTSADVTIDAGAGGAHDLTVYVKTQTQDTVFGKDGEVVIAVDAPATKWNEPSISLGSNIKNANNLDPYDLTALSDYEYVYSFKQITDVASSFDFYISAVSGVDPGASDDVKIRFLAKGQILDSLNPDKVRKAYFGNDASYTEIQGSTEEITIDEVA